MTRFVLIAFFLFAGPAIAADIPPVDVPDTMAERVKACIACHGPEDKEGRDAYYPRIAGKPEGYLFNQLRNFRDGRRHYRPMGLLLENLPDQYLRDIATYFASLKQAFPPPRTADCLARRNQTGSKTRDPGRSCAKNTRLR